MPPDLPRAVATVGTDFPGAGSTDTPAIYRTFVRHAHPSSGRASLEHHGYAWLVDVDRLPVLPWWLRLFTRLDPWDHFTGTDSDTFRGRLEDQLPGGGLRLRDAHITALLGTRTLRHGSDPLSLYWCHDPAGAMTGVVAEVRTAQGARHCYLLRADEIEVGPDGGDLFAVSVTVQRPGVPTFTATVSGERLPFTSSTILRARFAAPAASRAAAVRRCTSCAPTRTPGSGQTTDASRARKR